MQKRVKQENASVFLAVKAGDTKPCLHEFLAHDLTEKKLAKRISYLTTFTSPSKLALRGVPKVGGNTSSCAARCLWYTFKRLANKNRNGGGSCARKDYIGM